MSQVYYYSAMFIYFRCVCSKYKSANSRETAIVDGHPAWIMQGNIYEVNVRQYTREGTFNAFAKHLDRLKAMGVQTLWFMPLNPISVNRPERIIGQLLCSG